MNQAYSILWGKLNIFYDCFQCIYRLHKPRIPCDGCNEEAVVVNIYFDHRTIHITLVFQHTYHLGNILSGCAREEVVPMDSKILRVEVLVP